jgi:hypothetical protein
MGVGGAKILVAVACPKAVANPVYVPRISAIQAIVRAAGMAEVGARMRLHWRKYRG